MFALLIAAILAVFVVPAFAKDPFVPLVRPATTTGGAGGGSPATGSAPVTTSTGPALPQTGIDNLDVWLAASAELILMGAALIAFDRFRKLA